MSTIYQVLHEHGLLDDPRNVGFTVNQFPEGKIDQIREGVRTFYEQNIKRLLNDLSNRRLRYHVGPQMIFDPDNSMVARYGLQQFVPRSLLFADTFVGSDWLADWLLEPSPPPGTTSISYYEACSIDSKRERLLDGVLFLLGRKRLVEHGLLSLLSMVVVDSLGAVTKDSLKAAALGNDSFLESVEKNVVEVPGPDNGGPPWLALGGDEFHGHRAGEVSHLQESYADWLARDLVRGDILGSGYVPLNPVEWDLLRTLLGDRLKPAQRQLAVFDSIRLELPEALSLEHVLQLRERYAEDFFRFRRDYQDFISAVSNDEYPNSTDFETLVRDAEQRYVADSNSKLRRSISTYFADVGIKTLAVTAAVLPIAHDPANPLSYAPIVGSSLAAAHSFHKEQQHIKNHPIAFLLRVRQVEDK